LSLSRTYVYDAQHRLCKTIDPEAGATVYAYDAAGNLAWSASGLALPDAANCNRNEAAASGQVVSRSYDARNRLSELTFPDGRGDQFWNYTPDGLPSDVVTYNSGFESVTNSYTYNKRRLLVSEGQGLPFGGDQVTYRHDANGHVAGYSSGGVNVVYGVNALGQVTSVSSAEGTHASGVRYHPNGAVAGFTYGDGVVRTVQQNMRQLPSRITDAGVSDLEYTYDPNGNVTAILDPMRGGNFHRQMTYDGLDRLLTATSPSFGGDGVWRYTYDGLDNLRSATLNGVRSDRYVYDTRNRLTALRDASGATAMALDYDTHGNLSNKNGQGFVFDMGNRLREAGNGGAAERYQYDAYGRRARVIRPGNMATLDSLYSTAGQLLARRDRTSPITSAWHDTSYLYLGGQLLATVDRTIASREATVRYQHTDAQGTPVAESALSPSTSNMGDQPYRINGAIIIGPPNPVTPGNSLTVNRTDYTPYGAAIGKVVDGVGYTGHVMDAATGLTYMQQRYYDAEVGRFLSMDPVVVDPKIGGNFNRYHYANNNPYLFIDPDGSSGQLFWSAPDRVTYTVPYVIGLSDGAHLSISPGEINAAIAENFSGVVEFNGVNVTITAQAVMGRGPDPAASLAWVWRSRIPPPVSSGLHQLRPREEGGPARPASSGVSDGIATPTRLPAFFFTRYMAASAARMSSRVVRPCRG
jgi:RHS repeat-associated protein